MIDQNDIAPIGFFGKPHGYAGEINFSFDGFDDGEAFLQGGYPIILDMDGIWVPFFISEWRTKGSDYLLKFDDFPNIESVRILVNKEANALKKDIHTIDPEYDTEQVSVIGYSLIDAATGGNIGTIMDFDDTTANLLLKIETEEGEERLIPFHEDFVVAVDEQNHRLEVDLPEGIFDL